MQKSNEDIWEKVILPKNGILHTRINQNLLNDLKNKAQKENRTLSNLVETIIIEYLNKVNDYKLKDTK